MPTISTIIPTYNRAQFIREALDSVLTQSRPVNEIIVVDDGSTDNTPEVVRIFGDRIYYIRQRNRGPGAARNLGIKKAKGDYITFLDSDDIWVKDKIKMQMDFFTKHPHLDFVFGDMANFSEEEDSDEPEIKNQEIHDYFVGHASNLERIFDCLIMESVIPTPTIAYKRTCIRRIGFFDENLKVAEDLDYWLRASLSCRFGFVNSLLAKRRRHEGNLIKDWVMMNKAHLEVLSRIEKKVPNLTVRTQRLLANKLQGINYDLGSYFFKKRDFVMAYEYLKNGIPKKRINAKWCIKILASFVLQKFHLRSL